MTTPLFELTKAAMSAIIRASYDDTDRQHIEQYSSQVAEEAVAIAFKTAIEYAKVQSQIEKENE